MKKFFSLETFLGVFLAIILSMTSSACTEEQALPSSAQGKDFKINFRTDGPVSPDLVKKKVSERDNIPLGQILTCVYSGETTQGFYLYSLTTLYNGPKIYIVTQIIGDDCDGA